MNDVFSIDKRAAVMRRVKARGTAPELAVRRMVWRLGGRYRLNRADLPGKPDIVLAGRRLAIFVHGCFWHGHACKRGARVPKTHRDYWLEKVRRNRARDVAARIALEAAGWRVKVVWECELSDAALPARIALWLGARPGDAASDRPCYAVEVPVGAVTQDTGRRNDNMPTLTSEPAAISIATVGTPTCC